MSLKGALLAAGRASAVALNTFQRLVSFAFAATAFMVVLHRLSGSYQPHLRDVSYITISAISGLLALGAYWWFIEHYERRKNPGAYVVQIIVGLTMTAGILFYWMR